MAKITALDIADQLTGEEFLPIVQGADTKRTTMSAFRSLITPYLQNWYRGDKGDTGSSNNTRIDLAALKLAPTSDLTSLYDGSLWTWTAGDFTRRDDDLNIVKASAVALTVGAWVRQSNPADTRVNVLNFIPRALRAAILGRTVNNNVEQARALAGYIQNGIDAAALQRRRLHFPAGVYNIAPREGFAAEGGTCQRCFAIRSFMDIYGEDGATLRIVNGVSTDAAVVFMCMFGTNEILTRVSWHGLGMDMNGRNNPISPNRASGVYSLINQAMIYISGTPGGQAARINGAITERCCFVETPGVSCLVMGQSNVVGSGIGSGWDVIDCKFIDGGKDTIDHTAVYAWQEDVNGWRNLFENDTQFDITGGLVAWEVHGKNQLFFGNTVRRYYQGNWIDGNATNVTRNVRIIFNVYEEMKAYGVMYFGRIEAEEAVTDTTIAFNEINLDGSDLNAEDLKIGIGCTGPYSQTNARIFNNRINGAPSPVASAGIAVAAGTVAGQKHDRFEIADNTFEGVSLGISLSTNALVGLGAITLRGNHSVRLRVAGIIGLPQGIGFGGGGAQIDALTLVNNDCLDDRAGTQTAFGIRLEGAVGVLTKMGNTARGMTNGDYVEAGFTASARVGKFDFGIPYNPGVIAPGGSTFADVNVPNAMMGDGVTAVMNIDLAEVDVTCKMKTGADSSAGSSGVARVWFRNQGVTAFSGVSGTLKVTLDKMP